MNTFWSDSVQTTEELYSSRSLRFRKDNASVWLPECRVKDGMRILELGCAGGLLLHRISELLPNVNAVGIDQDSNHIAYAREKTKALGLHTEFLAGDALALPFSDNSFDLTLSYTVIEHVPTQPFLKEQYRVLKLGGQIVILSVRTAANLTGGAWIPVSDEERELSKKLWSQEGEFNAKNGIGSFELKEGEFLKELQKAGFKELDIDFFCLLPYAPDCASVLPALAEEQIETYRMNELGGIKKALSMSPGAINSAEEERLRILINKRYDERLRIYRSGEKLWDMATSTVLAAAGRKV